MNIKVSDIAVTVAPGLLALTPVTIQPVLVASLIAELGIPAERVGIAPTAYVTSLGVGMIVFAAALAKKNLRVIGLSSLAVTAIANSLLTSLTEFNLIVVALMVTGLSSGLFFSLTVTEIARSSEPDRGFGLFMAINLAYSAAIMNLTVIAVSSIGLQAFFIGMTALSIGVFCAILVAREKFSSLPAEREEPDVDNANTKNAGRRLTGLAVLGMVICFVGIGSIYVLFSPLATSVGVAPEKLKYSFMLAPVAGVIGTLTAVYLGVRFGRLKPLALGFSLFCVVLLTLLTTSVADIYLLAIPCWMLLWSFVYPYVNGLAAALSPGGKLVVFGSGLQTIALGAGPAIGSSVLSIAGYQGLLVFGAICFVASIVVFTPPLARTDNS